MNLVKQANPIALSKSAAGLAGTVAGVAGFAAKGAVHLVGAATGRSRPTVPSRDGDQDKQVRPDPRAAAPAGPTIVLAEPHAPEEPPIDVVGMALAAEAAAEREGGAYGGAFAHEPRAASRDEEHGDITLERTTVEEIIEETAAALDADSDEG